MDVSGQVHTLALQPLKKDPPVLILKGGWVGHSACLCLWSTGKSLVLPEIGLRLFSLSLCRLSFPGFCILCVFLWFRTRSSLKVLKRRGSHRKGISWIVRKRLDSQKEICPGNWIDCSGLYFVVSFFFFFPRISWQVITSQRTSFKRNGEVHFKDYFLIASPRR